MRRLKRRRVLVKRTKSSNETYKWATLFLLAFLVGFISYNPEKIRDRRVLKQVLKEKPIWEISDKYTSPIPSDEYIYVRGVDKKRPHHGHDLAATGGTTIVSTGNGRVIKRGYQVKKRTGKGYGNYLAIYDGKFIWRYAHMKSRTVEEGDIVRAGQKIGEVGDTGAPGEFHLHIECWTPTEWKKKEAGKNATPISKQLWQ